MVGAPRILGGRYEVGELIGRGGMADVHVGKDTRINRTVAIKILRVDLASDPIFQARFRREAQSAGGLNHPAIVAVYDTGEEPVVTYTGATINLPYIVMEYIEGHTVRALLSEGDAVPINEAVQITIGVLDALEYSHAKGIVHRDIKPGNIMLTNSGDTKVMDFGIARAIADSQSTMTQTNSVVGTAQYLSPEQARGEHVDTRSDIYSTGCIIYELLTGRPPFKGENATSVAVQHVQKLPTPPSKVAGDIPEAIDRIVMKALAKDREKRYSDAASFREDLKAALRGVSVLAPPVESWSRALQGAGVDPYLRENYSQDNSQSTGVNARVSKDAGGNSLNGNFAGSTTDGSFSNSGATVEISSLRNNNGSNISAVGEPTLVDQPGVAGSSNGSQQIYDNPTQIFASGTGRPQSLPYQSRAYPTQTQPSVNFPESTRDKTRSRANYWAWLLVIPLLLGAIYGGYLIRQSGSVPEPTPSEMVKMTLVPQLSGLDENGVRSALANAKLDYLKAADKPSETVPKGQFLDSDPKPGEQVRENSQVRVSFSSGPGQVKIPDLRNSSQEEARAALEQLGLKVGDVTTVNEPGAPVNKVIRTEPAAGENVDAGATIRLLVASGNLKVPKVVGLTKSAATKAIVDAGIVPVLTVVSSSKPEGTVVKQSPAPSLVPAGTNVQLAVSDGAGFTDDPDVSDGSGSSSDGGDSVGNGTGSGDASGTGGN